MTRIQGSVDPPAAVAELVRRLESAGYETWCVGGAVRDALLGAHPLDWDLATSAPPPEVQRLFRRTVPVGIAFGTVGVFDRAGRMHEVTTFRRDLRTDGRHALVEFGASLDDDLARRDFTINAIAYSPSRVELRDPFGGRKDLEEGVVRAVGDPADRMREDRLRALRAIRFAARLDFRLDDATWAAIVASVPHLSLLSAERVKQELEKTMMQVRCPGSALARWRDCGALAVLVPALADATGWQLAAPDHVGFPAATRRLERADQRLFVRTAALFTPLGSRGAGSALAALRFPRREIRLIAQMGDAWARLGDSIGAALLSRSGVSGAQVRTIVASIGRVRAPTFARVMSALYASRECEGMNAPARSRRASLYRRVVQSAFHDAVALADLALDGNDLVELGIASGAAVGKILGTLLAQVLDDPASNTREILIRRARELAEDV